MERKIANVLNIVTFTFLLCMMYSEVALRKIPIAATHINKIPFVHHKLLLQNSSCNSSSLQIELFDSISSGSILHGLWSKSIMFEFIDWNVMLSFKDSYSLIRMLLFVLEKSVKGCCYSRSLNRQINHRRKFFSSAIDACFVCQKRNQDH